MSNASQAKLVGFLIIMLAAFWMGLDLYILSQTVQEGTPRDSIGEIANAARVGSLILSGALCLVAATIAQEIAKLRMAISPRE